MPGNVFVGEINDHNFNLQSLVGNTALNELEQMYSHKTTLRSVATVRKIMLTVDRCYYLFVLLAVESESGTNSLERHVESRYGMQQYSQP